MSVFKVKNKVKWIVYTALFTALTAVAAMVVQVPSVGGGYTNLCDAIIFIAAALMDPIAAMIAGGLGALLADLLVYPATMAFSLAAHGAEGLIAGLMLSLIPRGKGKIQHVLDAAYMLVSGLVMMTVYYFTKAYVYGTPATALISLWRNAIQVALSLVAAYLLMYGLKIKKLFSSAGIYSTGSQSDDKDPAVEENLALAEEKIAADEKNLAADEKNLALAEEKLAAEEEKIAAEETAAPTETGEGGQGE